MQDFKLTLIQSCRQLLNSKLASLKAVMTDVTESANNETKSSVGDKHETSRAMMQLEQEKLGKQLQEAEQQLLEFDKTDFHKVTKVIINGSLVETDKGWFLIGASLGKVICEEKTVFIISPRSPIATVLMGAKEKDTLVFNGVSYTILSVN
jgi:transcription elongation GreA/GreB family factor